jgi:hypothetical protein
MALEALMNTARVPSNSVPTQSTEEKIRFRAYELFLKRGCEHGRHMEDWLQAEAELLRSKLGPAPVPTPIRSTPVATAPKRSRGKKNGN